MYIPYISFCWSFGTTSFRTRDFNRTIEQQLKLLNEFWALSENRGEAWRGNSMLQSRYYDFLHKEGFVEGNAKNKPKDAREKTSGLVDIGLIDNNRRLTEAGWALLAISESNDFTPDNALQIPKDSYIYLKQLLKTSSRIGGGTVRPFIIVLYVLSQVGYLTLEEFKYLLPLCTNAEFTTQIIVDIMKRRLHNEISVDDIIIGRLMGMDNYRIALDYLLENRVDEDLICSIGINRKSGVGGISKYDKEYLPLYNALYSVYVNNNSSDFIDVYKATTDVSIGIWWRRYIFNTVSTVAIERSPEACKNPTVFDGVKGEREFKEAFFKTMHLFKAKATLSDYFDLNRRYIKTTDIVLFEDGKVTLDIVPKHFFASIADELFAEAFKQTKLLFGNCPLEDIANCLRVDTPTVIDSVNAELNTDVATIDEARTALENNRYARLQRLIDTKFTNERILALLSHFENRNDAEIRNMVTDNADVPTIFEYVLGILWYKVSERRGRILDYMKLSLDADLLPKTHAAGGEADIVYEYARTEVYPAHALLLEATLADSTNQRRMEMEPVSRHLGQHLLSTGNLNSYCVFVTNNLNINVISDFRSRRTTLYYDMQDDSRRVNGMKIIPLETAELKKIVADGRTYKELYPLFEEAFLSTMQPREWYDTVIRNI